MTNQIRLLRNECVKQLFGQSQKYSHHQFLSGASSFASEFQVPLFRQWESTLPSDSDGQKYHWDRTFSGKLATSPLCTGVQAAKGSEEDTEATEPQLRASVMWKFSKQHSLDTTRNARFPDKITKSGVCIVHVLTAGKKLVAGPIAFPLLVLSSRFDM